MDLEYVAIDCMNRVHGMGLLSVNEQVYFMYDTTRLMMFTKMCIAHHWAAACCY